MTLAKSSGEQLGWLLDNLVSQVANVRQALVLSRDGLVVAKSRNIGREEGDRLSALAAGLHSLARGAGEQVGGGEVRQTIIEMNSAFLFVMEAGQGTCLAVLASADINLSVMAYEMAMLVRRIGTYLTAAPRPTTHDPSHGLTG
jgi:predicted regulator of Ras-like GTPase activity (Roadblock/LC7/MglB family)